MLDVLSLPPETIQKILLAALLGAIVGAERDISGRPAGLRTNLVIAVSACLFTILSVEGFSAMPAVDPSRVAAGIVTGIGFLGAGAIIHAENSVKGLTTAADIWLVSAIGMAAGLGFYALAIFVSVFTVLALVLLSPLSHTLEKGSKKRKWWQR